MFFFGSGRYREQLKLLYKAHKVINPEVHKVFHPQGFVATFKSLVTFVSGKNFVPLFLCVKILNF